MTSPNRSISRPRECARSAPALLIGFAAAVWSVSCRAQSIETYFPSGTGGYDQELGVTVLSRFRPLYESPGIQVGSFTVHSMLDQSGFYNSNVNGAPGSGSLGSFTSASASAASDWSRNSLAATLGMSHAQYFALPGDDHTDWNLGIGGGYTIGESQLTLAYAHQSYHQLGTAIGTIRTQTPVLDTTDSVRSDYTFQVGDLALTPDVSATAYRFGTATVNGVPLNQQFADSNVLAGGVTARYSRSQQGGILVVVRGLSTNYITPQPGQPTNDSKTLLLLGGFDFQAEGVLRYSFLAGLEVRSFAAAQFGTTTSPSVAGSIVWTPTGLTTITGVLSRVIESPQTPGLSGYILTQGRVVVDHELMRNVFLQGRGSVQFAQYLQSGTQTSFTLGGGVTWLLNRHLRLSADYDLTKQSAISNTAGTANRVTFVTGQYTQNLAMITLHLAL